MARIRKLSKRDQLNAEVEERHRRIKELLNAGYSVAEAAREVNITPKRVYAVAERHDLPTNPKVYPHSDDENTVARLIAIGWPKKKIAKLMNRSVEGVELILRQIEEEPVLEKTQRFMDNLD